MGKGSNTTSSSSTTVTRPDSQAEAAYRNLLQRAQGVAGTPYQAYSGPLTAFTNGQQNLGLAGVNANANYASPFIGDAASMARTASAPISAGDISNYLNPYTQNVVDATTAQMMRDFGQQNAQLQGNQISQGALGGNATGVAKALLAGQQGRQLASTTAGLYSQGFQQAVDAAQRQQQAGLAGANAIANYGIAGQGAALQGANAQWGIGTQQQGITQADYDRMYQQYQQAQAFPYQQTQWLAGLTTGVGSNLGGTSTSNGTTTGPAPNSTGQWIGAGLSLASMLSDRRAKEDVEKIGETNDGQNLYRYRYKGSPEWHIGPMAQEVEPEHRARGVDGMLYIDLKGATDDAVERASGGAVEGPWSGGLGWIPQMSIHAGPGAPSAPGLMSPKDPSGSGGTNPEAMAKGIVGAGKALGGLDWGGAWNAGLGNLSGEAWGGGSFLGGDAYGGSSAEPLTEYGLSADDYGPGFAAGGGVGESGLYDPGEPNALDDEAGLYDPGEVNALDRAVAPDFASRFAGDDPAKMGSMHPDDIPASVIDRTPGLVNPGAPVRVDGLSYRDNPDAPGGGLSRGLGRAGAPVQAADDDAELPAPAGVAGRTSGPARPPVMAFEDSEHYRRLPDAAPTAPQRRGFGLGLLSDNAATGLLAAGLGMLSSRSPFLGNVVGEGGLAGLRTYANAEEADRQAALEAQKLAREARQTAYKNWSDERKQSETERHNRATEEKVAADRLPPGMMLDDKGQLVNRPGYIKAMEDRTKAKTSGASMDDETAEFLANRVLAGDTKALVGLGRGAQGAENLAKINGIVARLAKEGSPVNDAARNILQNAAQQQGLIAAERTQAQIMAKLSVYGRTAFKATNIALGLSQEVPRTDWQPINKVLNAARTKTGDPKIVALGQALMTLSNEYARAIGGGHGTVHDKEAAERRLSEAQSHAQLEAVINVMRQEILAEEGAMPEAREHIRNIYNPRKGAGDHSISGEFGGKPPHGPVEGASGSGMTEGRTGQFNGRPVVVKGGKLIYSDTGEPAQ